MAKSKYPGFQILYEVGTKAELAKSYGVSERTMYRWLNRAKAETHERQSYPGAKTISRFKGTRKELAAKYNISERTAYRWINKARSEGVNIPSRVNQSNYPGAAILEEYGTNKALGDKYNVSESTIRRWKRKAQQEVAQAPEDIFEPDQTAEDFITEQVTGPESDEQSDEQTEYTESTDDYSKDYEFDDHLTNVSILTDLVIKNKKLVPDSVFMDLTRAKQESYLNSYVKYQAQHDPDLYYWVEVLGMTDISADSISTLNIWEDTFETWLTEQITLDSYNPDWLDNLM